MSVDSEILRPKFLQIQLLSSTNGPLNVSSYLTVLYILHTLLLCACSHYFIAGVSFYVLGKRLGALDENIPEDCHQFYTSVTDMFTATERLITSLPLHKIWPTRTYKELSNSTQTIYDFSMKYIKEKMEQISEEDKRVLEAAAARGEDEEGGVPKRVDFMTYLVHSGKMSLEEATLNGIDMLIGGVHPVSILYRNVKYCIYLKHFSSYDIKINLIISILVAEIHLSIANSPT